MPETYDKYVDDLLEATRNSNPGSLDAGLDKVLEEIPDEKVKFDIGDFISAYLYLMLDDSESKGKKERFKMIYTMIKNVHEKLKCPIDYIASATDEYKFFIGKEPYPVNVDSPSIPKRFWEDELWK